MAGLGRSDRVPEVVARAAPYFALALVVALFMRGWWNGALPASPRLELTPELGHIWSWMWRLGSILCWWALGSCLQRRGRPRKGTAR